MDNNARSSSITARLDFSDAALRAPHVLSALQKWSLELNERRMHFWGRVRNMILAEASRARPGDLLGQMEVDLERRLDDRERDSLATQHHQTLFALDILDDSGKLTQGHIRRAVDGILGPLPASDELNA